MSTKTPFEQWMAAVDAAISSRTFLTSDDLADQPYRAWFDDGMSPEEAADETLSNEGWFENGLFD
ncbi:MAG: hypothetical protein M9930_07510 [Anaerolineae bacterium]|nr:hypothetical protein [Anaerolineae bacterium]